MRALTPKGAATRQRIVEGAAKLIRDHGPANVGLDDIRAATATSKSQLFHYFPDGKADMLLAVAAHEAELVLDEQQPYLGDLTSWAQWEAWRDRVIARYAAQRRRCPLSALTAQLGLADPAVEGIITGMYSRWQAQIAAGVRAVRPDADAERVATQLIGAITGGATMLVATDDIRYLEIGLTEAIENLRRGAPGAGSSLR
ncbi:TetR/AcrR family transcriptional regulator [Herbidospora galbida]|uniref:TetR/AcrR family transcriptional regulator n=1 Tax=Herbidospora galbida TaxID=2575442 RepID=A0A4U3MP53_9ACTN|nr:TetR/AcrR family transcriptional regulator [Herbidospora galbida]TKK90492.1 TetR/AcrR family transcriptional regulator [Herbidospora galbida]